MKISLGYNQWNSILELLFLFFVFFLFINLPLNCRASTQEKLHTHRYLRFGDVGLYGVFGKATKYSHIIDFSIIQVEPEYFKPKQFRKDFERAANSGLRLILRVNFFGKFKKAMQLGNRPLDSVELYFNRFQNILGQIDRNKIYAVTLGEENIYWHRHDTLLIDMYNRLKHAYPEIPFYQWYSPTSIRLNVPGKHWPILPSDGWIIDHYNMTGELYERLVEEWITLSKPIIAVLWLSPSWYAGGRHKTAPGWWNTKGWKVFHHQLAVCQKHNLPTAFFMFWAPSQRGQKLKFLAEAPDASARKFFDHVLMRTLPYLKSGKKISLVTPDKRPDWIPQWPPNTDPVAGSQQEPVSKP